MDLNGRVPVVTLAASVPVAAEKAEENGKFYRTMLAVERERPAGEKACALGLRTLVAEQQQQQQGHHLPPPCFKVESLHQGLHSKGQGFITHGVTR